MDQLEGYVPEWNNEKNQLLIENLQKFSNEFFDRLETLHGKVKDSRFQAKDSLLKVKKDFHSALAIADKQFMEHVRHLYSERSQLSLKSLATIKKNRKNHSKIKKKT